MKLIDPNHPAYKPLWVRVLIVAVCFGWAIVEALGPQPFWAVLAGGLGVYAAWMLLFSFNPQPPKAEAESAAASDEADDDEPTDEKK
ncbi:hypothetical protein ACXHXG_10065 [Rhizobium sp. LEGMi198b]|uniref:hypothetical protein n=1 Tax=unclassified Rhizobium TaxID=2613769 RepID=UPI000CDF3FF0|nr:MULTISPECIES: hypothetical protein [Rhizobium]AVA22438.1 hypothetical protein NXC24_CH02807 [Rhizobium sp. NXC24]MDK4738505.1 hypothetical protein [Rhizobium sp. CNPSo 3464]UWU19872.1 hypothetical protein N2601_11180 [Rhizobium tropici]